MPSNFEQLVFEIIAKDAQASAAFDRFRRSVDDTSKSVDKNSSSLDKNTQAMGRSEKAATSAKGALIGTAVAAGAIASPLVAAGAGFTAFAGLAAPSVKTVVTALTGPGGLEAAWGTLDNRQRNAALGVQELGTRYTGLSKAMEPRTFQVFNQALGLANSLLGPLDKLALNAGTGVSQLMQDLSAHAGLQQFTGFLSQISGPSIAMVGGDITNIAHAVFALLQAFGGTGMLELRAFSGGLTAVTTSVTWLSEHAPGLTNAALAIGGIALALSKLGLLSGALKITGIANIATQMTGFAAATRGATLAEKGMLAATTALDAITPWGWVALGVAAIGGLVFELSRLRNGTEGTVAALEAQNKAAGFNTAGYFAAADAIGKLNAKQQQQDAGLKATTDGTKFAAGANAAFAQSTDALTAAQQANLTAGRNQAVFLTGLQQHYGLTRDAAVSLAVHAGVLASQVNKGGQSMRDAAARADAYANANLAAQRPTSQLAKDMADFANKTLTATDRTTALTSALKLFFNPAVTADQDVTTLKNDQVALAKALDASAGKTGLLTGKQRDARNAFDTYISQVAQTAADTFDATGKTSSYTHVINEALPILEKAAGHNKTLRAEIQALINTEKAMRSEHVQISVTGQGHWSVQSGGGFKVGPGGIRGARGLYVTQGTTPTADDVIARVSRGELVVPTNLVDAGAVDHLRGRIPGFAAGGVAGSYGGSSVPGLNKWLKSENAATVTAVANSVAASFKAAMQSLSTGTGGNVGSYAGDVLRALAMLGQPAADLGVVLRQMTTESGGNPLAVNRSDINWVLGHPSVGLMQVIGPTFSAYAGPFRGIGPFEYGTSVNPMANIYAALNYAIHRYGPGWTSVLGQGHGYDEGGYLPPGWSAAYNGTGRPEPVGAAAGGSHYHITVNVAPGGNLREAGRHMVEAIKKFEQGSGDSWRR